MNFKKILSYSALESIGSRVFDFAILWIVLNSFSVEDIANFGLATSAIFVFNLFLITPETSLLKFQKTWLAESALVEYVSAFVSFSLLKILLHYAAAFFLYLHAKEFNWFFYAVIFSAIVQQIQAAEIARIYMRMELKQKKVARFELVSKLFLLLACLTLFVDSSIELYFSVYMFWSLVVTMVWLLSLRKNVQFSLIYNKKACSLIWQAMMGFSFWTHISGVMTLYIYNGSLLFLGWLSAETEQIALYTVVNKVANLFFVIPMFLQSFVPIVLANAGASQSHKFNRLLFASGVLSVGQFIFFTLFGYWLGSFFGLENVEDINMFYQLGLIVSIGTMILNLSRPLSTYLLIKCSPRRVMCVVFIPAFIIASFLYPVCINYSGTFGAALASSSVYIIMGVFLLLYYFWFKKKNLI